MNLMQALEIEKNNYILTPHEKKSHKTINELFNLHKLATEMGVATVDFNKKINNKIKLDNSAARETMWKSFKKLTKEYKNSVDISGETPDHLTKLDELYKIKISKYRELADKFNMVIIPIEYTNIEALFDVCDDTEKMNSALSKFKTLLTSDTTTRYQIYILCPIDYYSVWEQVKTDVNKNMYYPEYFESMFDVLGMVMPTQKNLYLATQTNNSNIKKMASNIKENIKGLENKITKLSNKVNAIEMKQLEDARLKLELDNIEELKVAYRDYDPVLFAAPEEVDISESDDISIVGLCWGADIDEIVLDLKNIDIKNRDITPDVVNNKLINYVEENILIDDEILSNMTLGDKREMICSALKEIDLDNMATFINDRYVDKSFYGVHYTNILKHIPLDLTRYQNKHYSIGCCGVDGDNDTLDSTMEKLQNKIRSLNTRKINMYLNGCSILK